jgi:hypothetical protein
MQRPPTSPIPQGSSCSLLVAGLAVGAAGIHFAVAPVHLAEEPLEGYFFVGVAIAKRSVPSGCPATATVGCWPPAPLPTRWWPGCGWWFASAACRSGRSHGPRNHSASPTAWRPAWKLRLAATVLLLLAGLRLPIRRVPGPALAVGTVVAVITAAALLNLGMTP